jgi:hypothetical protein
VHAFNNELGIEWYARPLTLDSPTSGSRCEDSYPVAIAFEITKVTTLQGRMALPVGGCEARSTGCGHSPGRSPSGVTTDGGAPWPPHRRSANPYPMGVGNILSNHPPHPPGPYNFVPKKSAQSSPICPQLPRSQYEWEATRGSNQEQLSSESVAGHQAN